MNRICLFLLLSCSVFVVSAQLLDDSTQLVYGPSTINVVYEDDLLLNTDEKHFIDTSVVNIDRWDYYNKEWRRYQDLGNNGTARTPVFYELPDIIGRTSGYNAYNHLLTPARDFKYYDTKSPYLVVDGVIGGVGRSLAGLTYTQNINPNWNFGVTFHRLTSDKQIGASQNQFDRNVVSTTMSAHTYYKHDKIPYELMFHFSRLNHDVAETGGVFSPTDSIRSSLFQYVDSEIRLRGANANEKRNNWHLFHSFGLLKNFQIYHTFDYQTQEYGFKDFVDQNNSAGYNPYRDFYNQFLINNDTTDEQFTYRSVQNEAGLKGNLGAVYYRFYAKNRIINHSFTHLEAFSPITETYLGAVSQFRWKDLFLVNGQVEVMQSGEYLLKGNLASKLINLSYTSMRHSQSLIAQNFSGNHHNWSNNFSPAFINELKGSLNVSIGVFDLEPMARFTTLNNFVYFDEAANVQINNSALLMSQLGGEFKTFLPTNKAEMEGVRIHQQAFLTTVNGNNAAVMPVPTFFYNVRLYWDGTWFNDAIPVAWGIDLHARSGYFANTYQPDIQQFNLQNEWKVDTYVAADFFVNMRVDKIFVFAKLVHLNQPGDDGYFVTPLYPGLRRMFDFGVKWMFFD